MNHRPQRGGKVPTHKQAGMSEEEKYQMQVPCSHVRRLTFVITSPYFTAIHIPLDSLLKSALSICCRADKLQPAIVNNYVEFSGILANHIKHKWSHNWLHNGAEINAFNTLSPFSQPVTHPVDKDSDYFPIPSNFPRPDPEMVAKQHEMYQDMLSQRLPDTPQEDEIIQRSIMARRDQLKQVLNNAVNCMPVVVMHVRMFLWF